MPAGLDGLSFAPTLIGLPDAQEEHAYLYWEHGRRRQAIRMGRWKAFRPHPSKPIQLYDLEEDPTETTDVASAHPDVVKRVAALFEAARTKSAYFPLK